MVDDAFNKAKITRFAYCQTGSGKTYTMMGANNYKDMICPGLYLLCAYDIFSF
jgi:kinesin family protein 2/24